MGTIINHNKLLEEAAENHALQCHSKKASVATLAASIYDFKAGANWQHVQSPSRMRILNVWELGNWWKKLTKGSISTEHGTQLEYIQKHWDEGEYYDKICKEI